MLATVHSSITGLDVIVALAIVLVAYILEKVAPPLAWVALATLFLVAMFGLALTVKW